MTTTFALLCQTCGLSQREAADFLKVRPDTVKSWSSGRNRVPDGALDELAALAARIDIAADEAVDKFDSLAKKYGRPPEMIELGLASDDHEAQNLGWPCVGAHQALLGLVIARGMAEGWKFQIVPRGSTVATSAAEAFHRPT